MSYMYMLSYRPSSRSTAVLKFLALHVVKPQTTLACNFQLRMAHGDGVSSRVRGRRAWCWAQVPVMMLAAGRLQSASAAVLLRGRGRETVDACVVESGEFHCGLGGDSSWRLASRHASAAIAISAYAAGGGGGLGNDGVWPLSKWTLGLRGWGYAGSGGGRLDGKRKNMHGTEKVGGRAWHVARCGLAAT